MNNEETLLKQGSRHDSLHGLMARLSSMGLEIMGRRLPISATIAGPRGETVARYENGRWQSPSRRSWVRGW